MKKFRKVVALTVTASMLYQMLFPGVVFALTSGPSQPEMQSFSQADASNMVDLFTGDFSYNIPLLDVGGYPVNLSYQSGITMDQEASWVGLGWNLNPGAINRTLRGLPDDFYGDKVKKEFHIRPNWTAGIGAGGGVEVSGFPSSLNLDGGIFYNNYRGYGITYGVGIGLSKSEGALGNLTCGLGIQGNTQDGLNLSASVNYGKTDYLATKSFGLNLGASLSSREGLKALTMTPSYTGNWLEHMLNGNIGLGSKLGFSTPTYTPTISFPMADHSYTLAASLGTEAAVVDPHLKLKGFYSEQRLSRTEQEIPSYGYYYSDIGASYDNVLMDFNREKDVAYNKYVPDLPIPNFTYDLFSVTGQGMSGQIRVGRGDKGILFDHYCPSTSDAYSGGLEVAPGWILHGGVDLGYDHSSTETQKWNNDNTYKDKVGFDAYNTDIDYEPHYLKFIGEKTVDDETDFANIGGEDPVAVSLEEPGEAIPSLVRDHFGSISSISLANSNSRTNALNRTQREKRVQSVSMLTAAEAAQVGLSKVLESYPENKCVFNNCDPEVSISKIPRVRGNNANHMSEITVTNPNGKRYVYGLPAYNNYQKEASFSVSNGLSSDSLVQYNSNDDTPNNSNGLDHFYSAEILPAYAHSFLLTGVLSSDYVDRTGDGITDDDLGEAIKINYTRILPQYKWRVPIGSTTSHEASFNEGLTARDNDQKGSYLYGEKEIWYINSIESASYIAQFILNDNSDGGKPRLDALGVTGPEGGKSNSMTLRNLSEIRLYSKADLIANGNYAVPIKTVHFEYSYELCKGLPNSRSTSFGDSGKLTLKKVWFTYGDNDSQLNSYKFFYSAPNPNYNLNAFERWGYFQQNNRSYYPDNNHYPYVMQENVNSANANASAWNLTQINLPSGSSINVEYESDRYSYVQDKRAMQMCKILGFGITPDYSLSDFNLYKSIGLGSIDQNYMFVSVPDPVYSKAEVKKKYLEGVDYFYFKCLTNLKSSKSEWIPGYARILDYFYLPGQPNIICLQLKGADNNYNPICQAAYEFIRQELPEIAHNGYTDNSSLYDVVMGLIGIVDDISEMMNGFKKYYRNKNFAGSIVADKSFVRLNSPKEKMGGGSRVHKIVMNDRWSDDFSGENSASYGQIYTYGEGVASYEPALGNDENPFRTPIVYDDKMALAPNQEKYIEYPLGESFFPSPLVGYSTVTVQSINNYVSGVPHTGKTIYQYFTAKDFPVITRHTQPDNKPHGPNIISEILNVGRSESTTVSQGYSVEVNDMHGKLKSVDIFNNQDAPIESTVYTYHTDNPDAQQLHLNNQLQVVDPTGNLETKTMGEDIDFFTDMRDQSSTSEGGSIQGNLEFFILPIFIPVPIFIPSGWPEVDNSESQFRSAVTMKFIQRNGIIDKVTHSVNGSSVSTSNLAYDGETGNAIITEVDNEFNDPVYNLVFPAHWVYNGMGPAYKNIGAILSNLTVTQGLPSSTNANSVLTEGDEVAVYSNGAVVRKLWVARVQGNLTLIDEHGDPFSSDGYTNGVSLKVIRSGRKNMASSPVESLATLNNPVSLLGIQEAVYKILNASGTEYSDQWRVNSYSTPETMCSDPTNLSDSDCVELFLETVIKEFYPADESDNLTLDHITSLSSCGVSTLFGTDHLELEKYCRKTSLLGYNDTYFNYYEAKIGEYCRLIIVPWDVYEGFSTSMISFNQLSVDHHLYFKSLDCPVPNASYCFYIPRVDEDNKGALAYILCEKCETHCVNPLEANQHVNPYREGIYGSWRPSKSWVYRRDRSPDNLTQRRMREDGIYKGFFNFLSPVSTAGLSYEVSSGLTTNNWVLANEQTRIGVKGDGLENKNALEIFSASQYGFNNRIAVAVASNSRYKQIAFDGFEDYTYQSSCNNPCDSRHFSFMGALSNDEQIIVTQGASHTGKYSLQIPSGLTAMASYSIKPVDDAPLVIEDNINNCFELGSGIMEKFSPDDGQKYITSVWVKGLGNCYVHDGSYIPPHLIIECGSGGGPYYIFSPSGPVVEGWQRIFGTFEIPSGFSPDQIHISLSAGSNDPVAYYYFDDFRIHPLNSTMKSYAYDYLTLRMMAELDENNYAKFYEYNDEGKLVRTKKETERGIMTVNENRAFLKGPKDN